MLNADEHEERRAEKDGSDDAPAIEGVKQAHDARFIFRGAGFDDRADEHLEQTAADGVDHRGDEKSRESGDEIGQERHAEKSRRAENVGKQDRFPITELLHVFGGDEVGQKLRHEVDGDQKRDLLQRDLIRLTEGQKKKRRKINNDRLRYISDKAGENRMLMCQFVHEMLQPF